MLKLILLLPALLFAQITVWNSTGNLSQDELQIITSHIRSTVKAQDILPNVLREAAYSQSGAYSTETTFDIKAPTKALYASIYTSKNMTLNLTLTDLSSNTIINSYKITVKGSDIGDLLQAIPTAVSSLLEGKPDPSTHINTVNHPIYLGGTSDTIIHETHVIHHQPSPNNKKVFIPCSFCQGKGKTQDNKDCPYCSITSLYQGPETHGKSMTGHFK